MSEIVLFPELFSISFRVTPRSWHSESTDPILLVRMGLEEISGIGGLYRTRAIRTELEAHGWDWSQREEGLKYIHVDELEKIQGPPPEGAF